MKNGFDQLIVKEKILSCYIEERQYQEALDFFLDQMKAKRMKPSQYEQLGDLFTQVHNYESALNCYLTYLNVHYKDERVLCKKGQTLLSLGEMNLAMEEFNFALRINDRYAMASVVSG